MNINLRIERLVMDGLDISSGQCKQVKSAIEAELSHLLSESGLASALQSGAALPRVNVDPIRVSKDGNPHQLGQQIARSVYGGIGK